MPTGSNQDCDMAKRSSQKRRTAKRSQRQAQAIRRYQEDQRRRGNPMWSTPIDWYRLTESSKQQIMERFG